MATSLMTGLWLLAATSLAAPPASSTPAPDAVPSDESQEVPPATVPDTVPPAEADEFGLPSPVITHLIAIGKVDLAYTEALRSAFTAEGAIEETAYLRAGDILWQGEQWDSAARHFSAHPDPEIGNLGAAYSYSQAGKCNLALTFANQTSRPASDYLSGWCHLELGQPQSAGTAWGRIPEDHILRERAQLLHQAAANAPRLRRRSPVAAATMSALVPGLGQAYSGRWGEASSALIVNSLFGLAIWQLAQRDLPFGAAAVGFFGLAFYGGNIASAHQGANRFNRLAWERWVDGQRPAGDWSLHTVGADLQAR